MIYFGEICTRRLNNLKFALISFYKFSNIWDTLRDLVTLHNLKNVKNTHGGVLY